MRKEGTDEERLQAHGGVAEQSSEEDRSDDEAGAALQSVRRAEDGSDRNTSQVSNTYYVDPLYAETGEAPRLVVAAGDWHGHTQWACTVVHDVAPLLADEPVKVILHAGDFGIWPGAGGSIYLRMLTTVLERYEMIVVFVDGNHEWHSLLQQLARSVKRAGLIQITSRIFWAQRGTRWEWHGKKWLAVGGAVSVDKAIRRSEIDWWEGEELTPGEARGIASACQKTIDGPVDVFLSHDCPSRVPVTFGQPPSWWHVRDLARSDAHRERLQSIVDAAKPSLTINGHVHQGWQKRVIMDHGPVLATSLDCNGSPGNWRVLDVETLQWQEGMIGE